MSVMPRQSFISLLRILYNAMVTFCVVTLLFVCCSLGAILSAPPFSLLVVCWLLDYLGAGSSLPLQSFLALFPLIFPFGLCFLYIAPLLLQGGRALSSSSYTVAFISFFKFLDSSSCPLILIRQDLASFVRLS